MEARVLRTGTRVRIGCLESVDGRHTCYGHIHMLLVRQAEGFTVAMSIVEKPLAQMKV